MAKRKTNVQIVKIIMETGMLHGPFVMEAIRRYSETVLKDEAETLKQMEGTMINGHAWIQCAKDAKDIVEKAYEV